jgi:predicted cupin superfamily sugar epimerase
VGRLVEPNITGMTLVTDPTILARQLIDRLRLEPHPTGGFAAQTYCSRERIAARGLAAPFADGRQLGSARQLLVTPEHPVRLHRIDNERLYHRYLGDPLEVLALYPDGSHAVHVLGPDLVDGHKLQLLLPGGTFHAARLLDDGWFLGATTEWPGVEPEDVEMGSPFQLQEQYPRAAALIRDFT